MEILSFSPVALFVYNRLENTKKTIECLLANTLAKSTDVYVFSDGGKDCESWKKVEELRNFLHDEKERIDKEQLFRSFTIIERPENYYLERNIIEGISHIFSFRDRIIVLEDDICTSPYFLEYMNDGFTLYKDNPKVMHLSGFTNLNLLEEHPELLAQGDETYFTPHMSGWGWGTWREKWQNHFRHYKSRSEALEGMSQDDINAIQYNGEFPCLKSLDKDPIPWDICWELAIYKQEGLCLTPAKTMVRNIGLKGGTHFKTYDLLQTYIFDRPPLMRYLKVNKRTPLKDMRIEVLFAEAIHDWGIRYNLLGKIARFIYKKMKKKE